MGFVFYAIVDKGAVVDFEMGGPKAIFSSKEAAELALKNSNNKSPAFEVKAVRIIGASDA